MKNRRRWKYDEIEHGDEVLIRHDGDANVANRKYPLYDQVSTKIYKVTNTDGEMITIDEEIEKKHCTYKPGQEVVIILIFLIF